MGSRTEQGNWEARLLPACSDDGLDHGGSSGGGEKWLDSACVLELELPGLSDVVCECERSHGSAKIFGLSYRECELFSDGSGGLGLGNSLAGNMWVWLNLRCGCQPSR